MFGDEVHIQEQKKDIVNKILQDLKQIGNDLKTKLTQPATAQAGQIFRVKSVNDDGTLTLEAVDMPSGDSGGAVDDVQINGESIVNDGVAEIPIATNNGKYGLVKLTGDFCGIMSDAGLLKLKRVSNNFIDMRLDYGAPITSGNIDYAVKAAMCDGKGAAWTAEEQTSARERMGVISEDDFELIATVNPSKEEIVSSISIELAEPIKANFYIVCDIGIIDESLNYVNTPKLGLVINNYYTWVFQSLKKVVQKYDIC